MTDPTREALDTTTTVRPITEADRDAVVALLHAQLDEHDIPIAEGGVARVVDGMLADPRLGFLLVAERGGAVAGVACVALSWTLELGGMAAWLDELYVLPELRCHGIGRSLLHAAGERAREAGCIAMALEVEESHARAERLYEREGFRPLPRRRWEKRLA